MLGLIHILATGAALSHEIVKAARKKRSKVCWQCFAETFRETRFKELAANVMQEVRIGALYIYMREQDYLGGNGRQDAIARLAACGIWQKGLPE